MSEEFGLTAISNDIVGNDVVRAFFWSTMRSPAKLQTIRQIYGFVFPGQPQPLNNVVYAKDAALPEIARLQP